MNKRHFARTAAALAAALLSTAFAAAQTQAAPDSASANQAAKPSPYQGVSTPPPDGTITTSAEPPALPKTVAIQPAVPPPAVPATNPVPKVDPDAGLVVTTPVPDDSSDDDYSAPELKTRSADSAKSTDANSDADIVTYVRGPANALPTGTAFRVHILQDVDASDTVPGTPFRALLTQNLLHNGRIVVPVGSELHGKITYTSYGRRIGGRSVIHLRADEFVLPDGTRYLLHAQVIDTQGSDTKVIGEGNIAPAMHPKVMVAQVAIASGGGAVAGAGLGGPAGAAVGSAVGAGIIGAHWLMTTHAVYVPAHSTVVFSLTGPMFLTPAR